MKRVMAAPILFAGGLTKTEGNTTAQSLPFNGSGVEFYPKENQLRNCKQWPRKILSLIQVKKINFYLTFN